MAVVQNGSKVKNSKERSRQISSLTPPIGGPSVNLGEGPSLTPTEVGGWGVVRGFRFGLAGWVYLGIDLVRPALFGGSPCVESGFASLICGCSATLVTSTRGSLPDPQGHKGRTEEAPLTAAAVPHARGGQETQLQLSHWRTASPRIYIYIHIGLGAKNRGSASDRRSGTARSGGSGDSTPIVPLAYGFSPYIYIYIYI